METTSLVEMASKDMVETKNYGLITVWFILGMVYVEVPAALHSNCRIKIDVFHHVSVSTMASGKLLVHKRALHSCQIFWLNVIFVYSIP